MSNYVAVLSNLVGYEQNAAVSHLVFLGGRYEKKLANKNDKIGVRFNW